MSRRRNTSAMAWQWRRARRSEAFREWAVMSGLALIMPLLMAELVVIAAGFGAR